ncbi:LarC family nickel insertion protein [Geminicoccaceae bacterium 1502E]|nr:LarC family nickel insertion protein [Geminicoccaceae bacterium 1502E]
MAVERVAHIHLDAVGGIAGDMFAAALLDARPGLAEGLLAALRAAGLPGEIAVAVESGHSAGMAGRRFRVTAGDARPEPCGTFRRLRLRLLQSDLEEAVRERAVAILTVVAEAEADVHGMKVEEVHFHEIAGWDSLADVVAAAWLVEALGRPGFSAGALPLGGGRIEAAHGLLPVPAPATARLLEGFELVDDGIQGERVTPTGAAILRHLQPARTVPKSASRIAATGQGLGTRSLGHTPNMLRALLFTEAGPGFAEAAEVEQVGVLRFEIDDQTGEDLALALDRVREVEGVVDVVQWHAIGKRGRATASVQVVAKAAAVEAAIEACFAQTSTLGLRWRLEERRMLPREELEVETGGGSVAVKRAGRPGGSATAKAELRALEDPALDRAARERLRREAEARALEP